MRWAVHKVYKDSGHTVEITTRNNKPEAIEEAKRQRSLDNDPNTSYVVIRKLGK